MPVELPSNHSRESFGAALPLARHDGDCRRFSERREAEPGDAAEQRSHPVREEDAEKRDLPCKIPY